MSADATIDYEALYRMMASQYLLGPGSLHGPVHWRRVETIGLTLARDSGADVTFVRLFSIFHDSCRWNEGYDPEHGPRGAELAADCAKHHFALDGARLELLMFACRFHADGRNSADPTIGTCWDADRLDLPRVGLIPDPAMLSTRVAQQRETIAWALAMKR